MKNKIGSKKKHKIAMENHQNVMRGNKFSAKKVINSETGEVFISIREAALKNNINLSTLKSKLKGILINNTNLKYL